MESGTVDVLMITYNRPEYTRLSLVRLLETCDETMRVWLWHNGEDAGTLELVHSMAKHPRVKAFHHSPENQMLRGPTNWFWSNADGRYLSKVDDDCLVPDGWAQALRAAHEEVPEWGIVSCWPFLEEDFDPELAMGKIRPFGRHQLLLNLWVGGSGYVMKREVVEGQGLLGRQEAFSGYCLRAAKHGWVNGWYYPFLYMDHMDDPRSPNTLMRTEEDFRRTPSLSSRRFGTPSLEGLHEAARRAARDVQAASIDLRDHVGWASRIRRLRDRLLGRRPMARFHP